MVGEILLGVEFLTVITTLLYVGRLLLIGEGGLNSRGEDTYGWLVSRGTLSTSHTLQLSSDLLGGDIGSICKRSLKGQHVLERAR